MSATGLVTRSFPGGIRRNTCRVAARVTLTLVALVLAVSRAFAADWIYVVSDGDNLWDLSDSYLGSATNWHKVQKINQLPDPHRIHPGTLIRIPLDWIATNSVPASVRSVAGEAYLTRNDGSSEELRVGSLLHLGDRLQTSAGASVAVEFADRSVITVYEDSELSLDHLSAYGHTGMVDSRLRLTNGRAETHVTPAAGPGSRFEIHAPSAISAVRGTVYRMAVVDGGRATHVEVTGGTVDVSGTVGGEKARVRGGFGAVVAAGNPRITPRALLPGPVLDPLPDKLDRLSWPIVWLPVEGAERYRALLSDSPEFDTIRWQQVTEQARMRLPELPDGKYYLRVRAIDEVGLEGLDSRASLIQDARPQPPAPLNPPDAAVVLARAPELSWSRSLEASTYRLQIARDPGFDQLVLDREGLRPRSYTESRTAQTGSWYWRVASITKDGEEGPFGAVRQFSVKPVPTTPATETSSSGTEMTISWRQGGVAETYRVQIAKDKNFKRLILDKPLSEAQLTIEYIADHKRYFRVQAVDADGDNGAWGAVQEIPPLPDKSWKVFFGPIIMMLLFAL